MQIRQAELSDARAIAQIYNYYVENTTVTFEKTPVCEVDMSRRIQIIKSMELPFIVAENEQCELMGYAYATKWREREAYRLSVEVTVYVAQGSHGQGIGKSLYASLFIELKKGGYHAAMGGISLPNQASIALHESLGMKKVAQFEEVGFKFDRWIDVGYWQLMLEEFYPT